MYLVTDVRTGKQLALFLHIPRTAGTYIRKCLDFVGLSTEMIGCAHYHLAGVQSTSLFSFTFIRHPITWYPSMFAYSQEHGWDREESYPWTRAFQSDTLLGFVQNVARYYPEGYLYKLIERATVAPRKRINYVGKQEVVHMDLCIALAAIGVRADSKHIQEGMTDRINASERLPVLDLRTARAIEELEEETIRRWY